MGAPATKFENLQVLRFVAAMLVVLYHAAGQYALNQGTLPLTYVANIGYAGVDLFFVISGFVIYRTTIGMTGPVPAAAFLVRRYGRIFLPYWPIAIALGLGITAVSPAHVDWVKSLTLWPYADGDYNLPAAWTLSYELAYYTVFAVAILLSARLAVALLALALVIGVTVLQLVGVNLPDWLTYAAVPLDLEFLAGVAIGWLTLRRSPKRIWPWLLAAGVVGFAVTGIAFMTLQIQPIGRSGYVLRVLCFGTSAALIVAAVAGMEAQVQPPKLLVLLGDATYSLYLLHGAILIALWSNTSMRLLGRAPLDVLLAGSLVLPIFAALAYLLIVERPLLRLLNPLRRLEGQSGEAAAVMHKMQVSPLSIK